MTSNKPSPTPSLASVRATYPTRLAIVSPVPNSLQGPEAELWRTITSRTKFTEPAHLDMLEQALIARALARQYRTIVQDEGPLVTDKFDQLKPHPLIQSALAYDRRYLTYLHRLGLDLYDEARDR
jgi:hypothetical protein